jgi:hypothetical protein
MHINEMGATLFHLQLEDHLDLWTCHENIATAGRGALFCPFEILLSLAISQQTFQCNEGCML